MSIQFHFCDLYNNFPLNQKIDINKSCVEKVIATFEKDGTDLKEYENLLFFFYDRSNFNYPEELGAFINKTSPEYDDFIKNYGFEINNIKNFPVFDNIIFLSIILGDCHNETFKVLSIAHECQHFIQSIEVKNINLKDIVLKKYLRMKCLYSNKTYRELPTEIDAFRTSKRIAYKIYCKEKVEKFIDEEIEYYRSRLLRIRKNSMMFDNENEKKNYWEYVKSINPDVPFDLKIEFEKIWAVYEKDIKDEINRVYEVPSDKMKESEKDFLKAQNIYNKYSKR